MSDMKDSVFIVPMAFSPSYSNIQLLSMYRIFPLQHRLSCELLVSNERRVKGGHYDCQRSKKWVWNERRGTEILRLMSARALIQGNMVHQYYTLFPWAKVKLLSDPIYSFLWCFSKEVLWEFMKNTAEHTTHKYSQCLLLIHYHTQFTHKIICTNNKGLLEN